MNKEQAVEIMLESINADNREMCLNSGMSPEDTETNIANSQHSLGVMMQNIYDKLVEHGTIVVQ